MNGMCGYHIRCKNSMLKCPECKRYNPQNEVDYLEDIFEEPKKKGNVCPQDILQILKKE